MSEADRPLQAVAKDGVRLAVDDTGAGTGPPVVLANGLALPLTSWNPVTALLTAAGRRVVRFDWRGHGASDDPGTGFAMNDLVADLGVVVDAALSNSGHDQVDLIGLSLGGSVAAQYSLTHPATVRSTTLVGAMVIGQVPSPEFLRWAEDTQTALAAAGLPAARAFLAASALYRSSTPWVEAAVLTTLHAAAFIPENLASVAEQASAPTTDVDRWRDRAEHLPPLALLVGEKDDAFASVLDTDLPAIRERLPLAGHLAILDRPDLVAAAILGVLT